MRMLVLALSLAFFAGCAGPAQFSGEAPIGIKRWAEVDSGLARGSQPNEHGIAALAGRGFRTVVSLRQDKDERARVTAAGMRYVEIPMKIGPFGAPAPTEAQARAFLDAVTDSAGRPAFVHCHHGRDRTGVMVALYRVEVSGWSGDDAVHEAEERGLRPQYKAYRRWIRERAPSAMLPADPTSKEAHP
jgi:protein tyrosine phosphatase (PTP) superfamily phosphohydrolase (DUF442 family)